MSNTVGVVDHTRLTEFQDLQKKWIEWTVSQDENSLESQFSSMFWADAVFRLINETRRSTNKELAAYNGPLAELVDSGYVAGQAIAIRRLVDRREDVISLRRVARDLAKHRAVISREIYVCRSGWPYDYEQADEERLKELMAKPSGVATFGDAGPDLARRAHETFDRLSKVDASSRARDDQIHQDVFDLIERSIEGSGARAIVRSANKYLFHAADFASRKNVPSLEPTIAEISAVHANLARVGNCLSAQILGEGPCALGVATAQFDMLSSLDKPFIEKSDRGRLQDWWSAHSDASFRLSYEALLP